ncbi:polyprenyl synthetase family protein [Natrinema soli]|uniref:Polyprenyl synthetase family protein n=1 Tax=Natrinema soli TaxID=1930624 RepID=A0ABD5SWU5_9EURY|nr:polyprenyl synthetase family protein [Natrinema soli]
MARELSLTDRRAEIDGRLELALDAADSGRLAPASTTVLERDTRWYGQLVALSHNSLATTPDRPEVVPAATAIELLRGYLRLREELILQLGTEATDSVQWEVTPALLASDYLYTSAYSTLGTLTADRIAECVEELTTVSESIIEALGSDCLPSPPSPAEYWSSIDNTAGALGRGAAVIGATLADIDDPDGDHFATLGRGLGTVWQIQDILASDGPAVRAGTSLTERRLRQHAKRRLRETDHALQQLSSAVDVTSLRAFGAETVSESIAGSNGD